jgi:hypothetical protein
MQERRAKTSVYPGLRQPVLDDRDLAISRAQDLAARCNGRELKQIHIYPISRQEEVSLDTDLFFIRRTGSIPWMVQVACAYPEVLAQENKSITIRNGTILAW